MDDDDDDDDDDIGCQVPVKVQPSTVTEFLFVTEPKRFAPAQAGKTSI